MFCAGFFFSSRRRHTRYIGDWSSDVCSSDLRAGDGAVRGTHAGVRGRVPGGHRRARGTEAGAVSGDAKERLGELRRVRDHRNSIEFAVYCPSLEGCMQRKWVTGLSLVTLLSWAVLSWAAGGQDAGAVIGSATKALGADNLKPLEFSGSGFDFVLGQAPSPSSPWPRFNDKTYTRVID